MLIQPGSPATAPQIPYGKQAINQADIDAVVEVLKSDWLTQGPTIPRFEQLATDYTGATHGVAVSGAGTQIRTG